MAASAGDGLAVVAGGIEAFVGRSADDPADVGVVPTADRERLAHELAEAEVRLATARGRLANLDFLTRAPPHIVDGARASEAELAEIVVRLRARLEA